MKHSKRRDAHSRRPCFVLQWSYVRHFGDSLRYVRSKFARNWLSYLTKMSTSATFWPAANSHIFVDFHGFEINEKRFAQNVMFRKTVIPKMFHQSIRWKTRFDFSIECNKSNKPDPVQTNARDYTFFVQDVHVSPFSDDFINFKIQCAIVGSTHERTSALISRFSKMLTCATNFRASRTVVFFQCRHFWN